MIPIHPVERFLFESSRRRFIVVIVLISFVKTGIWYMPNIEESRRIAIDPFVNPFSNPFAHYLYWNWLSPFLAWLVGANQSRTFILFHLAFALAFTSLFVVSIFRRLAEREARTAFVIFSALPVSGTIYYWVGMDAVILFLMLVPLLFPGNRLLAFIVGIAMGMQHFEQSAVAGSLLLAACLVSIRWRLAAPYSPAFAGMWILGAVTGKLALLALFFHWDVSINSGRILLTGHEIWTYLREAAFHFHVILWSALGAGWIVLMGYVGRLRGEASPLVVGLLLGSAMLLVVEDQTRVISIITFPLLAGYWFFNAPFLRTVRRRELSWIFVLWLLVPWSWAWKGIPRWSAFPYDLYWLLDKILGPLPARWIDSFRLFT